jgi:hypothetical protein
MDHKMEDASLYVGRMKHATKMRDVEPLQGTHCCDRPSRAPRIQQLSLLVFARPSASAPGRGWIRTGSLPIRVTHTAPRVDFASVHVRECFPSHRHAQ